MLFLLNKHKEKKHLKILVDPITASLLIDPILKRESRGSFQDSEFMSRESNSFVQFATRSSCFLVPGTKTTFVRVFAGAPEACHGSALPGTTMI
jgi:hypothetical protein